jgi:hypothetical protein
MPTPPPQASQAQPDNKPRLLLTVICHSAFVRTGGGGSMGRK